MWGFLRGCGCVVGYSEVGQEIADSGTLAPQNLAVLCEVFRE
jgi:hypothetical protein